MASYFITHPEVIVDPHVPIESWGLSPEGYDRARLIPRMCWDDGVVQIASSTEQKAIEAADILAIAVDRPVLRVAALGENNRSSTGYLPLTEFEVVADEFFAHPHVSVRGWETAADAQQPLFDILPLLLTAQSGLFFTPTSPSSLLAGNLTSRDRAAGSSSTQKPGLRCTSGVESPRESIEPSANKVVNHVRYLVLRIVQTYRDVSLPAAESLQDDARERNGMP
jgi:broad specificity phosphatase PhoE